ncbi:MAG: hypothetical protein KAX19_00420, partial [Candidatus Brocadiae bacterium]|nr:hypothetical protein [Candidatus Brocadiia bacterium]
LAAGRYVLAAGLSEPGVRWLHRAAPAGSIVISPRDVYQTGRPPDSAKFLLALDHFWRIPYDDEGLKKIG